MFLTLSIRPLVALWRVEEDSAPLESAFGTPGLIGCRQELLNRQAGHGDQRSQCPTGDFRVIGTRECHESARLRQHNVAASLPGDSPTQTLERANLARSQLGLRFCLPLTDAAWDRGALGDIRPVFVSIDADHELHAAPYSKPWRMRSTANGLWAVPRPLQGRQPSSRSRVTRYSEKATGPLNPLREQYCGLTRIYHRVPSRGA